ncbi:hypothetical protein PINS_up016531 [Pythium insidiosum]|nr:hypothetical protein PINS_up016531 [Pythium insidiosum]
MRKVVIRQIPHDVDEETVYARILDAHDVSRSHIWRFVPGKVRGNNRPPYPGRLYLDFKKDTELATSVVAQLKGAEITSSKGTVTLDVDFAPFQKIPREKQRRDPKVGTIEKDPEYLAFLEDLAKPAEKLPSADLALDSKDGAAVEKPVAALVQYLNERRRDKGKGKFGAKSTDKSRTSRKSTKDKAGKERGKSSSTKSKSKTSDSKSRKEGGKPKRSRAKSARDTSAADQAMEPGMVKIMGPKGNFQGSEGANADAAQAVGKVESAAAQKGKGGRGGGKGSRRQPKEQTPNDAPTDAAAPSRDGKGGRGGRRDSRSSKGGKNGAGRGEKKIFAPKAPTQAPVG